MAIIRQSIQNNVVENKMYLVSLDFLLSLVEQGPWEVTGDVVVLSLVLVDAAGDWYTDCEQFARLFESVACVNPA